MTLNQQGGDQSDEEPDARLSLERPSEDEVRELEWNPIRSSKGASLRLVWSPMKLGRLSAHQADCPPSFSKKARVSHPPATITDMGDALIDQAIELLEKANADLEPELLPAPAARTLLASYARARRLVDFGIAGLSRKLDDASALARVTGTSMANARATVATGKALATSQPLSQALEQGDISLDQAAEIAPAEASSPGAATELVDVAKKEAFHVLKEKALKTRLEAEQHKDLFARQHAARYGRSHVDELGLVHIDLALEPHAGAPIVARAEAEAARLAKKAQASREGTKEPFERHLADAYTALLSGSGKGPAAAPSSSSWSATRSQNGAGGTCERESCARSPGSGRSRPRSRERSPRTPFCLGSFATARTCASSRAGARTSRSRS